ncbi:MAG: hypothetical protein WBL68_15145, partial [Nitrososphaeraceae archaeon]
MTIQELSASPEQILELWNSREGMKAEATFKLGCKPKAREKQLINSMGGIYRIDTERGKAKVVIGHYSNNQQTYTYALEVAAAPRTDLDANHAGEVEIIDCINDLASPGGGGAYFDGGDYNWTGEKGKLKGIPQSAKSIKEIAYKCGFDHNSHLSKAKKPCLLFINLKCRVIEWLGSKGKTHIQTTPFARDIAETVSKLVYLMPSYHGEGYGRTYTSTLTKKKTAIEYLVNFLIERNKAVDANPNLIVVDRLTQST